METKIEQWTGPLAYVEQLEYNSKSDQEKLIALQEEHSILRETCWCILSSITDEDDRKYLRDALINGTDTDEDEIK